MDADEVDGVRDARVSQALCHLEDRLMFVSLDRHK